MRTGALLLSIGLLAGCRDPDPPIQNQSLDEIAAAVERAPGPPYQLLDRIEARLEGKPCIGRLDGWVRSCSYDLHSEFDRSAPLRNAIDERHILLNFRETAAGRGGRRFSVPGGFIDDSPVKVVIGRYDRATDKVHIDYCGGNFGGGAPGVENLVL